MAVGDALHALILGAHIVTGTMTAGGALHALVACAYAVAAVAIGGALLTLGPGTDIGSRAIGVV